MTKLRDAAQQALDVLDEAWGYYPDEAIDSGKRLLAATDALRAALDEPEPYDQCTLDLCPVCCWKTVIPGEPCLMCERNERMCEPAVSDILTRWKTGILCSQDAMVLLFRSYPSNPALPMGERAELITEHAAYQMGAVGAPPKEYERLLFEAWMRGHCWALSATWRGTQYKSDREEGGDLDPRAMQTRRLWAAWRDRAALSADMLEADGSKTPCGQALEIDRHES